MNSENLKTKSLQTSVKSSSVYTDTRDTKKQPKSYSKLKGRNPLATLCENSQLVPQNVPQKRTSCSSIKETCVNSTKLRSKSAGGLDTNHCLKSKKITVRSVSKKSDDEEVFVEGEKHYVNYLSQNEENEHVVKRKNESKIVKPLPVVRVYGDFSKKIATREPAKKITLDKKLGRRSGRFKFEDLYNNALYSDEYFMDNYKYMLKTEEKFVYRSSYLHKYIDYGSRVAIVNWLVYVHQVLDLSESTLFVTVRMLDYVLIKTVVPVKEYVLMAITCMWITIKVYETNRTSIHKLFAICNGKFSKCQMISMEREILKTLDFKINFPEPSTFLYYYLKEENLENHIKILFGALFLLEMFTMLLQFSSSSPSILASAALYLVLQKFDMDCAPFVNYIQSHLLQENVFKIYCEKMGTCIKKLLECKGIISNEVVAKYSVPDKLNVAQYFLRETA